MKILLLIAQRYVISILRVVRLLFSMYGHCVQLLLIIKSYIKPSVTYWTFLIKNDYVVFVDAFLVYI